MCNNGGRCGHTTDKPQFNKTKTWREDCHPNQQRVASKVEAQSEHVHVAPTSLGTFWRQIRLLSRWLSTKFLRRSSGGSLLRVRCWLGYSIHLFFLLYLCFFLFLKTSIMGPSCFRLLVCCALVGHAFLSWPTRTILLVDVGGSIQHPENDATQLTHSQLVSPAKRGRGWVFMSIF